MYSIIGCRTVVAAVVHSNPCAASMTPVIISAVTVWTTVTVWTVIIVTPVVVKAVVVKAVVTVVWTIAAVVAV